MKAKEWSFVDKSKWGPGPWQEECDKAQWQDEETGFACLIHRGGSGALCGYVGVPEGHPWHGKDDREIDADCHGGLTFSNHCRTPDENGRGICRVPGPDEPAHLWWLGFDCAHLGDVLPKQDADLREHGYAGMVARHDFTNSYKTLAYVKREVAMLAKQAMEAGKQ
jgi:hypothetical protein